MKRKNLNFLLIVLLFSNIKTSQNLIDPNIKPDVVEEQWENISSGIDGTISRFNWLQRKNDQRNAYIDYNNLVEITRSVEEVISAFERKINEVEVLYFSFEKKLENFAINLSKSFKNFDSLKKNCEFLHKKIKLFQENKDFYNYDKDHKKKFALLEKQAEDLLLRFENIKDNFDLVESAKNNLKNSINVIHEIFEKLKNYENLTWESYLKFDELISDSIIKDEIKKIKNNLDNANQYNSYIRSIFLNYFNSTVKEISNGMNFIENSLEEFKNERKIIIDEIKIFENFIKIHEEEKLKKEQEEIEKQRLEFLKKEKELHDKMLANRPWYIKFKDLITKYFKEINYFFHEGYKVSIQIVNNLFKKNKTNENKKIINNNLNKNENIEPVKLDNSKELENEIELLKEKQKINFENEKNFKNLNNNEEKKEEKKEVLVVNNNSTENNNNLNQPSNIKKQENNLKQVQSKVEETVPIENNLNQQEVKNDNVGQPQVQVQAQPQVQEAANQDQQNVNGVQQVDQQNQNIQLLSSENVVPPVVQNNVDATNQQNNVQANDNNVGDNNQNNNQNNNNNTPNEEKENNEKTENSLVPSDSEIIGDSDNSASNDSQNNQFDPSTEAQAQNFSNKIKGNSQNNNNNNNDDNDDYNNNDNDDSNNSKNLLEGAVETFAKGKIESKILTELNPKKAEAAIKTKDADSSSPAIKKIENNMQSSVQKTENNVKPLQKNEKKVENLTLKKNKRKKI